MSLETFFVAVVVAGAMVAAFWLYAAVFDFVDAWKKKERERDRAMLTEARLPPMTPLEETCASRESSMLALKTHMLKLDDTLKGPPIGHERRPNRPKAARMMD